MKLVIGGYAQGKLEFALQRYKEEKWAVFDGRLPSEKQLQELCKQKKKMHNLGVPMVAQCFKNPTSIHEDVNSIT